MSDYAIQVEGLGKRYRLRHETGPRYRSLREDVQATVRRWLGAGSAAQGSSEEEFWALRDVSFEVKPGEVVGIIGHNGAGKSTILKILSRITEPSEGRVRTRGRVASLLEVGTGFHPELTGRENIFLNGVILGLTRAQVRERFDAIVAFAEVERFLDTQVKFYSSGMYVRLAFAVAAHLDPEILVVDEVLSVGDAAFQRKCLGKMGEVRESGRTILFVSHQMQSVRQLCHRVVWLNRGRVMALGPADETINKYLTSDARADTLQTVNEEIARLPPDPGFRLKSVDVRQEGKSTTDLSSGKPVEIVLAYDVLQAAHGLHVYFLLCDMDGTLIFESLHNGDDPEYLPLVEPGSYVSTALIPADFLAGRAYDLRIHGGIHSVRVFFKPPLSIGLHVHSAGLVNRAYAGYDTPGKLAPLIAWRTERHAA